MVSIRGVLGVLGVCNTTNVLDNGHLVLAAKADRELRSLTIAIWKKIDYYMGFVTDSKSKRGIEYHTTAPKRRN